MDEDLSEEAPEWSARRKALHGEGGPFCICGQHNYRKKPASGSLTSAARE